MNVYQKLNAARTAFHAKALKKTGRNNFAGYDYFELGDFLIPAMESMAASGLSAFISFDETLAKLTIVNCDKPDEQIVIASPMSSCEMKGLHKVQQLGAVQTYLRRYLWVAALEIVEHDALDATTGSDQPKQIKQGAKDGIGDDLPEDWKAYLKDLAEQVTNWVTVQNNPAKAKALIAECVEKDKLEGDMVIFMERHLDSKVRTALRNLK